MVTFDDWFVYLHKPNIKHLSMIEYFDSLINTDMVYSDLEVCQDTLMKYLGYNRSMFRDSLYLSIVVSGARGYFCKTNGVSRETLSQGLSDLSFTNLHSKFGDIQRWCRSNMAEALENAWGYGFEIAVAEWRQVVKSVSKKSVNLDLFCTYSALKGVFELYCRKSGENLTKVYNNEVYRIKHLSIPYATRIEMLRQWLRENTRGFLSAY